jgi:cytochrome c6
MKRVFQIAGMLLMAGVALSGSAQQPVEAVYKANCAMCHGATGEANTPAGKNFKVPSFSSDAVLKESDAEMLTIAKNGKGKMPAWHDKLTDEQLKELVGFIRTLQKKP